MIKGDKISVTDKATGSKMPAIFVRFNNENSKMLVQVDGALKWVGVDDTPLPFAAQKESDFVFPDDLDNKEKLEKELKKTTTKIPRYQQTLILWDAGNRDLNGIAKQLGATPNYVKRVIKEHRNGQK